MNGDDTPRRKERTGLIKMFRDALDEALEGDPVQPIRDGYDKVFENNEKSQMNSSSLEGAELGDPLLHIRDTYQQILDNECSPEADQDDQQTANNSINGADPFQRVRDSYQQVLEDYEQKYLESQKKKSDGLPWWKRLF
jgi:hypothetical protein